MAAKHARQQRDRQMSVHCSPISLDTLTASKITRDELAKRQCVANHACLWATVGLTSTTLYVLKHSKFTDCFARLSIIVHEVRKSIFVADDYVVRIGSRLYRGAVDLPLLRRQGTNTTRSRGCKIDGIRYNKATAVDERTGDVYFGSENGLYKYDSGSNTAVDIGLYNINILKLVIRNGEMYLIDADDHMLYRVMDNATAVTKVGSGRQLCSSMSITARIVISST
ncbi:hypothetical protein EVAR_49736_1 [Eumeta japonica]|uniref:Ommochrome-binding protein n=1 Tax=Eumeta variegata TaxID=151549 RepID=A0A4C1ZS22_EUMVA|nr:hypothetical protein EVAR_49736_1 [Eumeta japonica]